MSEFTPDVRDLLDEADAKLTDWQARHEPGHALNIRTSGAEAADALREAYRLLLAHADTVRAEVDAYDAQAASILGYALGDIADEPGGGKHR